MELRDKRQTRPVATAIDNRLQQQEGSGDTAESRKTVHMLSHIPESGSPQMKGRGFSLELVHSQAQWDRTLPLIMCGTIGQCQGVSDPWNSEMAC